MALLSAAPASAQLIPFFQQLFDPSFPSGPASLQMGTVVVRGAMGSPGLVLYNENREPVPPGTEGAIPRWVEYWTEEDPDQPESIANGARALPSDVEFCTECVAVSRAAWEAENARLALELERLEVLEQEENASVVRDRLDRRLAVQLSPEMTSLLVDPDEFVVATAEGTIAYQVAYFIPTDSDGSFCAADLYGLEPSASTAWTGTQFRSCDTRTMEALLAPMFGQVTGTSLTDIATTVNQHGFYSLQIHSVIGGIYGVDAAVRWSAINPRAGGGSLHLAGFTGTVVSGAARNVNFPVDIRVMSAPYAFDNVLRLENGFGDVCTVAMVDTSDDAPVGLRLGGIQTVTTDPALTEAWSEAHTAYSTDFEAICTGGPGCDNASLSPACSGDHKGLVSRIEANDMMNTTVYVFRESDGRLLGKRWGIPQHGINCDPAVAFGDQSHLCRPVTSSVRGAEGQLRFTVRGPSLQPRFEVDDRLQDEVLEQELTDFHSNPLRPGDSLRIVAINHATGYIGTARTTVSGEVLGTPIPQITLRPPNLRIWAERTWTVSDGATAGEDRRNTIGGEGSGLISDQTLTVYTEWLDEDGSPLPDGLPGYTGRVARVIAEPGEGVEHLGRLLPVGDGEEDDDAEHVGQFSIVPGRSTQVLRLPAAEGADRAHYYVHVSGSSLTDGAREGTGLEEGPSFSVLEVCFRTRSGGDEPVRCVTREIDLDPDAPPNFMRERPMRLVPVLTPRYNHAATLARRHAALALGRPDPGPINDWVYRPEYHFSLLELEEVEVGRHTADGHDVPLLGDDTEGADHVFRSDDQWLWSDAVVGEPDEDDLGRFTGGRDMGMYVGDAEGEIINGRWTFYPDQLGSLDEDDYVTIRLAQREDRGNTLWEFAFEVERLELARRYHRPVFDGGHPQPHMEVPVDDYRILEFGLGDEARISAVIYEPALGPDFGVSLLRSAEDPEVTLDDVTLSAGQWRIPVTYEEVWAALEDPEEISEFVVEVHRLPEEGSDEQATVLARIEGVLVAQRSGLPLGQAMTRGVRLHDGAYQIARTDFAIPGRGVPMVIGRTYENTRNVEGILGPGWQHSVENHARPLAHVEEGGGGANGFGNVPPWVTRGLGRFTPSAELVPDEESVASIQVMDTTFVRVGDAWFPERGRHDRLEVVGGTNGVADPMVTTFGLQCGDEGCLRLTTPEGDRFWYRMPRTMLKRSEQPEGVFPLRDLQPPAEPLLLTADRYDNATRYRVFVAEAQDSPDGNCISRQLAGQTCRVELDLHPTEAGGMTPLRSCRFEYARIPGLNTPRPRRLVATVCGEVGGWTGPHAPDVVITYGYDSTSGHLTSVSRSHREETYEYGAFVSVETPRTHRNLERVIDPIGHTTSITYASTAGQVGMSAEEVDEGFSHHLVVLGITEQTVQAEEVLGCEASMGPQRSWGFSYSGFDRTITDALGREISRSLNRVGNANVLEDPAGTTITEWTVDDWANLENTVDNVIGMIERQHPSLEGGARRTINQHLPERRGYLQSQTDTLGATTSYDWHPSLRLPKGITSQRRNSHLEMQWTDEGLLTGVNDVRNQPWGIHPRVTGEPESVTAPGDVQGYIEMAWNRAGMLERVKRPGAPEETMAYDWRGNLRAHTRQSVTTTLTYDALDNLTSRTLPPQPTPSSEMFPGELPEELVEGQKPSMGNEQETWTHDSLGRVLTHTDLNGTTMTYRYDIEGRVISIDRIAGADTASVKMAYDALGRLVGETSWNGTVTCHVWSEDGLSVATVNAHGDTMSRRFNAAGELIELVDFAGRTLTRQLDELGRVKQETLVGDGELGHRRDVSYEDGMDGLEGAALRVTEHIRRGEEHADLIITSTYDPQGLLLRQEHGPSVQEFTYDARGNMVLSRLEEGEERRCVGMRWDDADRVLLEVLLGDQCNVNLDELHQASGIATAYAYDPATGLPASITHTGQLPGLDPASQETRFEYDAWNRLVAQTFEGHDEIEYTHRFARNSVGHVIATRDPAGHNFWQLRDRLGRVVAETDSAMLGDMSHAPTDRPWVSTTYYADGRVQRTVDPYDGVRKWVLDADGDRVTQVRHAAPGGLARALAIEGFDGMGNPLAVTDFDGTRWTMAYSPRNEVVSMCPAVGDEGGEGEGACRERAYLLDGSVLSETDLDGHETRYRYDELGRVAEVVDPLGLSRTFAWSIGDELHSVTDHRGWMDVTEHDAWGRVVRRLEGRANALVEIERRVVDGLGRVLEVQDARGHVTRMSYDGRGLMTRLELPPVAGSVHAEERSYNAAGHLERMVDGDGVVVAFETDGVGRVVEEVLAPETLAEARTSLRYDAMGRLTEVVRPRHQDTDVARRMEWDGLGRLAKVVDEAGNETHHEWDASDRLLEVWEGPRYTEGVLRSSYRYTALGYLTRHEQWVEPDGERLVTEWLEHTGEGLPGRRVTASGEELLEWDAVGRPLRSEIRALGETSAPGIWRAALRESEYLDEQGLVRLTEASFDPEAAGVFDGQGYATASALAQVAVVDTTERLFDERGWLRRETVVRPEGELEVHFDYDANGNRRSQITIASWLNELEGERTTEWAWDARNRLESLETPAGASTWTHTPGGRVSRVDYANGTRAAFEHDEHTGRMTEITHREGVAGSAEVMAAVNYTYDLNGNRASQELAIGGVTETTTYTYDAVDQLRSFSVVPGAGAAPDAHTRHTWYGHERYRRVYEGRCRRGTLVPDVSAAGGMRCDGDGMQTMDSTLSYDGPHGQISQVSNALGAHSAGEGASLVTYEHDAAGNLVERRTQEGSGGDPQVEVDLFRYDALDRLVEVARGPPGAEAVVGQYGYNADGLRTRVRESGRNADAWYDGLALLVERVQQGGSSEWNTVRYHHDPGGLHAITADHDGAGTRSTHFAHRDAMGSTLVVSRPDAGALGLVAASYRTDPWGMVTAETGVDHVNASIFTGHQHDVDTGLIYMRARFYDPALGRFLSADSWLGDTGNPPSLQRYLYAYGNPGVWWDPDGRQSVALTECLVGLDSGTHRSECYAVEFPDLVTEAIEQWLPACAQAMGGNMGEAAVRACALTQVRFEVAERGSARIRRVRGVTDVEETPGDVAVPGQGDPLEGDVVLSLEEQLQYYISECDPAQNYRECHQGMRRSHNALVDAYLTDPINEAREAGEREYRVAALITGGLAGAYAAYRFYRAAKDLQTAAGTTGSAVQRSDGSGTPPPSSQRSRTNADSSGDSGRSVEGSRRTAENLLRGSGPVPGVIEVSPRVRSTSQFRAYSPSDPVEFVFDPGTRRFVVGRPHQSTPGMSPHQQLAASIGADESRVVGGALVRGPDGRVLTNEASGHYHRNWTDSVRREMVDLLEELTGLIVDHHPGM